MTPQILEWAQRNSVSLQALRELTQLFLSVPDKTDAGSESRVQGEIRLAAPEFGGCMLRNNSGGCTDDTGRVIRYGLGNDSKQINDVYKSPDLVGTTPMRIEAHHVGRIIGVATYCEVKEPGWKSPRQSNKREQAQAAFLTHQAGMGALCLFATHVDHYRNAIGEFRK